MRSIVSCSQVRRFRTGRVVGQGGVQRAQDAAQGQHQPGEGEFTMMFGEPPNPACGWGYPSLPLFKYEYCAHTMAEFVFIYSILMLSNCILICILAKFI